VENLTKKLCIKRSEDYYIFFS